MLAELQSNFQNYLLEGAEDKIIDQVVHSPSIPADLRLQIYKNAYQWRLLGSLAKHYVTVQTILGKEKWNELARAYLQSFPSRYRSIRWFGTQLASFIEQSAMSQAKMPFSIPSLGGNCCPFLTEVAKLDWMFSILFDAPNESALFSSQDMTKIPMETWPRMRFCFIPSVHRLNLDWNTMEIRQCIKAKEKAKENTNENKDNNKNEKWPIPQKFATPQYWLFWREKLKIRYHSLQADMAWAIDAALQGRDFAELCEGLCEWYAEDQVGMQAAAIVKHWLDSHLIARVFVE